MIILEHSIILSVSEREYNHGLLMKLMHGNVDLEVQDWILFVIKNYIV